ncbi:MAG: hypothetical protein KDK65_03890 [Chlamydiia bacterium]|nr:hypothetical protein [Chlamydiia bacterium]
MIIIVTSNASRRRFWEERLTQTLPHLLSSPPPFIVTEEEWPAGNGLGTLNALKAHTSHPTIALYHTAGAGSRLHPLTSLEEEDKGAVRLPSRITPHHTLTLLEATIKQTFLTNCIPKNRISVFWCDQLFFPTETPTHNAHLTLFAKPTSTPDSNYGLITHNKLYEKTSTPPPGPYHTSLGSFTLSHPLLHALLSTFSEELTTKKDKKNTDPDFWMPYTGSTHCPRITTLKLSLSNDLPFFSLANIGEKAPWYDFGTFSLYCQHIQNLPTPLKAFLNPLSINPHIEKDTLHYTSEQKIQYNKPKR